MKNLVYFLLIGLNFLFIKSNAQTSSFDSLERFSFKNPYISSENCQIHIRIEYYFLCEFPNGDITSHVGMQEGVLNDFSACSFNMRGSSYPEASFIFQDAVFIITSGGYQYEFSFNEHNQNYCGGNCEGDEAYNCVVMQIENISQTQISYILFNGIITGYPPFEKKKY